jgi:hypothetical protein
MQTLLEQQPVAQLAEVQTHWPLVQRWPAMHAALLPHLQLPPVQLSARLVSQPVHAAPPEPHAPVLAVTQAPLESQQPLGQLAASQPQLPLEQL